MKTENITKADQSMEFVVSDLREAYKDAIAAKDEFAVIVLLDIVDRASDLSRRIRQAAGAAGVESE